MVSFENWLFDRDICYSGGEAGHPLITGLQIWILLPPTCWSVSGGRVNLILLQMTQAGALRGQFVATTVWMLIFGRESKWLFKGWVCFGVFFLAFKPSPTLFLSISTQGAVTLAHSGKVPRLNIAFPQVFIPMLIVAIPMRLRTQPAFTWRKRTERGHILMPTLGTTVLYCCLILHKAGRWCVKNYFVELNIILKIVRCFYFVVVVVDIKGLKKIVALAKLLLGIS